MHFGIPTLIELKSTEACAALCRELGLDFVELNMNLPEYQPDRIDTAVTTGTSSYVGSYLDRS